MKEYIQIIIHSAQVIENVIPNQVRVNLYVGPFGFGVIKTTSNIRIYCSCVFHVRAGPNKSYDPKCDQERLSPYYKLLVKGITSESKLFN